MKCIGPFVVSAVLHFKREALGRWHLKFAIGFGILGLELGFTGLLLSNLNCVTLMDVYFYNKVKK